MIKTYPHGITREDIPEAKFGFDDIGIYRDGELIKSFNSLSNDYALTAANKFSLELVQRINRGEEC